MDFLNPWGFDFADLSVCVPLFHVRPYTFFCLHGFKGNPVLCPPGRNLHRTALCSVKQTHTK